jgi:hypothetical protein
LGQFPEVKSDYRDTSRFCSHACVAEVNDLVYKTLTSGPALEKNLVS